MLKVEALRKTYNAGTANQTLALQGVDLTVAAGSFVVLLGGNGSGKSTFLGSLAGTVAVDSGSILIDGVDVTSWPEHKRAALVGRVFQNPFSGVAANMSIAENFALAAKRGFARNLGWALSRKFLNEVQELVSSLKMGLEDRLHNPIGGLSGGQRQALTLLMATWQKPKILLLDEHTAALDPKSAEQVIQLTREIVTQHKLTTLMVTHSMQQAVNLGDRLIMFHAGNVLYDFCGAAKERLQVGELLGIFDDIRSRECLDESAADLLRQLYV